MATDRISRRMALLAGASACLLPQALGAQSFPPDVEGGIGGTGIVGVLSDFGSLIIAGARVAQTPQTRYTDAFGTVAASALRRGDSLTVEATEIQGRLSAVRVHVTQPLIGLAQNSGAQSDRITVNGIDVLVDSAFSQDLIGERVSVSGIWQGTRVVASRVARTPHKEDVIAGDVLRRGTQTRIGTIVLRGRGIGPLPDGSFATVTGQFDQTTGRLTARSTSAGRFTGAAGPLKGLRVEGFLDPINTSPGFKISGLGHSFERGLALSPYAQDRTLFAGAYTGRFKAQTATILPDDDAARRRVLRALSQR
ncbi:MAG: DUF5666 domain-containing protein [Roseobacter sp.]